MPKKSASTTQPTAPKARKPRAAKALPTQEDIALRAYHIFLERNGAPGNPLEDWTRAERELLEASAPKARRNSKVVSIAA